MKIGIIHQSLDVIGGSEQITLSLLDMLGETEFEVTLYTTSKDVKIPDGVKKKIVKRRSFPIGWKLQRILEINSLFDAAKNEDLILVMGGNLAISKVKKPTLIFCNSNFETEINYVKSKSFGIFRAYHSFVKKQIQGQLELLKSPLVKIIANSIYTKEKIKGSIGKNSIVIYPPVRLEKMDPKESKKGIITVARYSPEKNLEFAVNVLREMNVQCKIFGSASYKTQFEIYNSLLKLAKGKNIKLFCNEKREFIEKSLYQAKVYFQSSKETFGISVVEGIMAGCIPIVPDNSAHKETVPFKELRYKENDVEDAKNKIQSAINGEFDTESLIDISID